MSSQALTFWRSQIVISRVVRDRGFGRTPGVFEFKPSYLPKGKSVADVKKEMLSAIKAAAPSYGAFNRTR